MNAVNLKPCPFCGGKADFDERQCNDEFAYCVECVTPDCDCFVRTVWCATKEEAAEMWNRRTGVKDDVENR